MEALTENKLPNIEADIRTAIEKEIHIYQPRSNWASTLGSPCVRQGVHRRLDWTHREKISTTQAMIFNGGKVIEQHIAKVYLEKAGYEIVEADRPIQDEKSGLLQKLQIGGKLDFICRKDGFEFPVEVKSVAHHNWEKINAIEDLLFSKHSWVKNYPAQLTLYMLAKNAEYGCFMLISKQTFEPKFIWINLDMTYAEELCQRAEIINKNVADKTYPERIPYDDNICNKCEFATLCLKDIVRTEAEILDDAELVDELEERESLKVARGRYEELDKTVKKKLANIKKGVAGDFMVLGKAVHRDAYLVEPSDYWQVSIKKLGGGK
jgi:CRISPR/Cas system-associated exonuclease Cas4 (RecB family)